MTNDHAPRITHREYFLAIDEAASATTAEDVRRVRTDVLQRWPGDPWAGDLAEVLSEHEARLAEQEHARHLQQSRATSPIANRASLRAGR